MPPAVPVAPEKDRQFSRRGSSVVGMVAMWGSWDGRRVRRLVLALAVALLPGGFAEAADQTVTGTVAPVLGVGVGDGAGAGGTVRSTVTRELRGDTLYVTVMPAG